MSKIKLQTANTQKKNQKNILPFVGLVEFDENGQIEVDEIHANDLISVMPEFSLVVDLVDPDEAPPIKPQTEENDLGKGDDKGQIQPQTNENEVLGAASTKVEETPSIPAPKVEEKTPEIKKTPEELTSALGEKSAADLKKILADFPEEETKPLKNKEQYIAYLVTKLS